ncbi:nucleotide-diphospho-sugar transferase [Chytriomyces sp. MP71]|nr:nucleotide-diphospho-sugar transferase [Chytriomyces sp. MP71]
MAPLLPKPFRRTHARLTVLILICATILAEIDRIWDKWRKSGMDKTFHAQFAAREDWKVARMMNDADYFEDGGPKLSVGTQIPKLIHQVYKTKDRTRIEPDRLAYMDTWITMNRGFNYTIWTDKEMMAFVKENYPGRILRAYKKLPMIVQKSDFFRYLLLYKLGGYYADTDTRCARHVNWWRIRNENNNIQFIAGLEWYLPPPDFPNTPTSVTNWAFASIPGHPLLNETITTVLHAIESTPATQLQDVTRVVEITGPAQFTRVMQAWLGGFGDAVREGEAAFYARDGVLLLPPVAMNPGTFEPNVTLRDQRTVLYHEFMGNRGWKVAEGAKRLAGRLFGEKAKNLDREVGEAEE